MGTPSLLKRSLGNRNHYLLYHMRTSEVSFKDTLSQDTIGTSKVWG